MGFVLATKDNSNANQRITRDTVGDVMIDDGFWK